MVKVNRFKHRGAKLGKKAPAAANATKVDVRSKALSLSRQFETDASGQAVVGRVKAVSERPLVVLALEKLCADSAPLRRHALKSLDDAVLVTTPDVWEGSAALIAALLLSALDHPDKGVRTTGLMALCTICPYIRDSPFGRVYTPFAELWLYPLGISAQTSQRMLRNKALEATLELLLSIQSWRDGNGVGNDGLRPQPTAPASAGFRYDRERGLHVVRPWATLALSTGEDLSSPSLTADGGQAKLETALLTLIPPLFVCADSEGRGSALRVLEQLLSLLTESPAARDVLLQQLKTTAVELAQLSGAERCCWINVILFAGTANKHWIAVSSSDLEEASAHALQAAWRYQIAQVSPDESMIQEIGTMMWKRGIIYKGMLTDRFLPLDPGVVLRSHCEVDVPLLLGECIRAQLELTPAFQKNLAYYARRHALPLRELLPFVPYFVPFLAAPLLRWMVQQASGRQAELLGQLLIAAGAKMTPAALLSSLFHLASSLESIEQQHNFLEGCGRRLQAVSGPVLVPLLNAKGGEEGAYILRGIEQCKGIQGGLQ
jgi:hypothetical protein